MKTAIKLVLIYFLMQVLGMLTVIPFALLYVYVSTGALDGDSANRIALAPSLLAGMAYMFWYLWRKGWLKDDGYLYSRLSSAYCGWSLLAGASLIVLIDGLMSLLTFLPDWMEQTFDVMQGGWPGIVGIAVLGPVLEELLFRGAITKALLRRYTPVKGIVLSALVFGIFHINPAQVVGATLSGLLFAWFYYKSRSVVPGILIHILNNSLSVGMSLEFPEADYTWQLTGIPVFAGMVAVAACLFLLACRKLNGYETQYVPSEESLKQTF